MAKPEGQHLPPSERVLVDAHRVQCEGVGGALGHPRVYLEMGHGDSVECPYCDRLFVLRGGAQDFVRAR